MVAQLLGLRLHTLAGAFRQPRALLIATLVILAAALALVLAAAFGLASLAASTPDIARAVVVPSGSLIVLGFVLLPLVFGADDPLDPRRFVWFAPAPGRLAAGLVVAATAGPPAVAVAVLGIATVVTWARGPVEVALALLSVVLLVPTCVLAARVSSTLAALFLRARAARDAAGVILVASIAVTAPVAAVSANVDWESRVLPVMRRLESLLGWTPLGAVWSVPAEAANGQAGASALKLAIAVAFILLLALVYRMLVGYALARPERRGVDRVSTGLGWFAALPASPAGVIAARSLSYWGRDGRYRLALAAIPIVPLVTVPALLIAGMPAAVIVWLPVPLACLLLGWLVHNDLAHDSTAFWEHVSSSTSGVADRWGRAVPPLLIGIPAAVLGSVVTVAVAGLWGSLPALLGLSVGALLAALGVSSVASAAFPYPTAHPGDSAFVQPQAVGSNGVGTQAVSLLLAALLMAPVVSAIVFGMPSAPWWCWVALGGGLGIGAAVLVAGVALGGRVIDRRGPELLAFTLQN